MGMGHTPKILEKIPDSLLTVRAKGKNSNIRKVPDFPVSQQQVGEDRGLVITGILSMRIVLHIMSVCHSQPCW